MFDHTNLHIRSLRPWLGLPLQRCMSGRPGSAASVAQCCHRSQNRLSGRSLGNRCDEELVITERQGENKLNYPDLKNKKIFQSYYYIYFYRHSCLGLLLCSQ